MFIRLSLCSLAPALLACVTACKRERPPAPPTPERSEARSAEDAASTDAQVVDEADSKELESPASVDTEVADTEVEEVYGTKLVGLDPCDLYLQDYLRCIDDAHAGVSQGDDPQGGLAIDRGLAGGRSC